MCSACGVESDREYAVESRGERADLTVEEYVLRCAACDAETDRFSG